MDKIDIIEGLLYLVGDTGLTEDELINNVPITKMQLHNEIKNYNKPHLEINQYGNRFFLQTSDSMEKYIKRILKSQPSSKLSQASLEVLSIISYNQPVNRQDIETLRGVASDGPISTLLMKGLIQKKTIENERAHRFVTTNYFLQVFGLKSLDDLPKQENANQEEMDLFFNQLEDNNE